MKHLVNFFIVGQPKSGTTALAQFMSEHQDVYLSTPKEIGFFSTDHRNESDRFHKKPVYFLIRTLRQYQALFSNVTNQTAIGEASTNYLYSKTAAKNIYQYNPEARIIIMLRNPIDFMQSLHMQYVNETKETELDFAKALKLEKQRVAGINVPKNAPCPSYLFYLQRAGYAAQVKRYLDTFPRENIYTLSTEEFQRDNAKCYREILRFLRVSTSFTPQFRAVHSSKAPKSIHLNRLLNNQIMKNYLLRLIGIRRYSTVQKRVADLMMRPQARAVMPQALRNKLYQKLKPEVNRLSRLVGKDFAEDWRTG